MTLFFKKKNSLATKDFTTQLDVTLDIANFKEIQKQIAMIHLTKNDLSILLHLQPLIDELLETTVNSFYSSLEAEPKLMNIIANNSSVERLKKALYHHLFEMFSGVIDSNYLNQRKTIALVHVKIGLEPKWYMGAFETLHYEFTKFIMNLSVSKVDQLNALSAINKVLNLEQQLVLEAYEIENQRLRLEEQLRKDEVRKKVYETAQNLTAISEETCASIEQLSHQTQTIKEFTADNLSFVNKTEEKTQHGQKFVTKQTEEIRLITNSIRTLKENMSQLHISSNSIREIVGLVTTIANQTNLLALNAAIEAARAGEHGVGFAVVAAEVRKLSEDTKDAISSVSTLIQQTDDGILDMTNSVNQMSELINNSTETYDHISNSFHDIVLAMTGIKKQSEQSNTEITTITQILNDLNEAVDLIANSSDGLISTVNSL